MSIQMKAFILAAVFLAAVDSAVARTCQALFENETVLSSMVLAKINEYAVDEKFRRVPERHRTSVSLVRNTLNQPVKRKISALLIHGLYNSPAAFAALEAHLLSLGINVVNLRLDGHYEADKTPMQHTVRWQQWLKSGRRARQLAQELGESVILVGHSTGALTTAWLAYENPVGVRGLAMFAPAIRVLSSKRWGAEVLDAFDVDLNDPSGRFITGHAGAQVTAMANSFQRFKARLPVVLAETPVWMANTAFEKTIDLAAADGFLTSLTRFEPGEAPRLGVTLPASAQVTHEKLAGERNPEFPSLVKSFDEFFGLGNPEIIR